MLPAGCPTVQQGTKMWCSCAIHAIVCSCLCTQTVLIRSASASSEGTNQMPLQYNNPIKDLQLAYLAHADIDIGCPDPRSRLAHSVFWNKHCSALLEACDMMIKECMHWAMSQTPSSTPSAVGGLGHKPPDFNKRVKHQAAGGKQQRACSVQHHCSSAQHATPLFFA